MKLVHVRVYRSLDFTSYIKPCICSRTSPIYPCLCRRSSPIYPCILYQIPLFIPLSLFLLTEYYIFKIYRIFVQKCMLFRTQQFLILEQIKEHKSKNLYITHIPGWLLNLEGPNYSSQQVKPMSSFIWDQESWKFFFLFTFVTNISYVSTRSLLF
jgi:hypothetical protein